MKDETTEMLKLITNSNDPIKAALAAYALLLEFLKKKDSEVKLKFTHDFPHVFPS